jgi:tRNA threonylcarbamoyladenosine biosynthesis protein TsaB
VNLIALESSTHTLSVALWRDGVVVEHGEELPNAGSQHLLPWISDLLVVAGLSIADVDAIAFGSGPGAFAGLRLACGVAQGLAVGLNVPVLGVCTLEALALASGGSEVYACMDARMGEVYCGAYSIHDGIPTIIQAPGVFAPGAVPQPPSANWLGVGNGFKVYDSLLRQRLGQAIGAVRADVQPTAGSVARIAVLRLSGGDRADAAEAIPLYIRDAVALTTAERLARGGVR